MKKYLLLILMVFWCSVSLAAIEDYTTYTTSGTGLTITSTRITEAVYSNLPVVYKDFGSNYFTTFNNHQFTYYNGNIGAEGGIWARHFYYSLSDVAGASNSDMDTANKGIALMWYSPSGTRSVRLKNYNGDEEDATTDADIIGALKTVYVTVVKTETTITAYLYSDSGRTVLEDTLSVGCTDNFRYLSAIRGNNGGDTDYEGYVENLDLNTTSATIYTNKISNAKINQMKVY
jgi:hypothetical protein